MTRHYPRKTRVLHLIAVQCKWPLTDWSTGASSYVERAPHETKYGHEKKVCLEKKNISTGSDCKEKVISCFISPLFIMFLYIRKMTTKASNGKIFIFYTWNNKQLLKGTESDQWHSFTFQLFLSKVEDKGNNFEQLPCRGVHQLIPTSYQIHLLLQIDHLLPPPIHNWQAKT